MRVSHSIFCVVVLACLATPAGAQAQNPAARRWSTYVTPSKMTTVDFPGWLFSERTGPPDEGSGEKFETADGRAELIVYDLPNKRHDTPRSYLRRHLVFARSSLQYRRVSDRFFAISSIKDDLTFYSRCNFSGGRGTMHCIYVAYPQRETRKWDDVVTRLSLSLREGS